jgi:hypothetical protein
LSILLFLFELINVGVSGIAPELLPPQGSGLLLSYTPKTKKENQHLNIFLFGFSFDAFSASQNSFTITQPEPLKIGFLSIFGGGVIFSAEFYQTPSYIFSFAANFAFSCHSFVVKFNKNLIIFVFFWQIKDVFKINFFQD